MNTNSKNVFKNLRPSFVWERVICRLLAAWCGFAAFNLMKEGDFFNLEYAQDTSLFRVFLISFLLFAIYSIVNVLLQAYETDTWFLLLGATVCVTRWLAVYKNSKNQFLFMMAVIVVYSLFVLYFVQKNHLLWKQWQPGKKTVWAAAIVAGAVCGFFIAGITCYRYLTFSSPNFDFGLFVNMFHNMKETGLPLSTAERDVLLSHFVVHISPIYYLLLPFYFIFPSPLTLQIGQAVVLASGVIPVLLLCRHFKLSGKITMLATLIYALYPALSGGCFYDIHENCFLTPLLLWLFYFFEREKYPWMYLFAFLTLMVKEDAAVYVILFALFVLLSKKKFLHGALLLAGSLAYFGIALAILEATSSHYAQLYADATPNPSISGPMINRFNNLIFDAADGLVGVIKTALVNPGFLLTQLFTTTGGGWEKFIYFLQMFLPLGFLPFCSKKASRWLLIVPVLMNLLTNYQYQYDVGFQYHFGITAFLVYATIMNLPDLKSPNRQNIISFAAVACCCMYIVTVIPKYTTYADRWDNGKETFQKMEEILDTIPEDASVTCSTFILSHVADRDEVYEISYHLKKTVNKPKTVNDFQPLDLPTDYIIFDCRYAMSAEDKLRLQIYRNNGYEIVEEHEGLLLILTRTEAMVS
ncbi:MAG: DUF2079 domain-containing protein [Ruminococcaceae bacterium]|nr:DUF2079 domain-containing protein [Oscillospiraceae bacterium]